MITKLKDILKRADSWPEHMQAELAEIALAMETAMRGGGYRATPEELQAIDEADRSGVASDAQVEDAFATFRRA